MTDVEYQDAVARLTAADTEIAALGQAERDCIQRAQEYNDARRTAARKRQEVERTIQPLRDAVAAHQQEVKRQQAERAKAEAEAKAKEPKAPSQIDVLTAQVAKLTALLEAKG